jgi:hypothetical protein
MPQIAVRTRGPIASFTVTCTDGAAHAFTVTLDGTVTNTHHDPDEAAVMIALGGRPNPCGQALQVLDAARTVYNARTGQSDTPDARYTNRRGWHTPTDCPACGTHGTATHINSLDHQLGVHALTDAQRAGDTLLRWMHRHGRPSTVLTTQRDYLTRGNPTIRSARRVYLNRYDLTTVEFLTAGRALFGSDDRAVLALRRNGISTQWLTALSRTLTPRGIDHIRRTHTQAEAGTGRPSPIERALIKARNVSPRTVADYLNAGIHSHLHTYARAHARPDQVLAVYAATNGTTTLADLLATGLSAPDAVASAAHRTSGPAR